MDRKEKLLEAALGHVVFDGWSDATFRAAAADIGISADAARLAFPRGATDLAAAYHKRADKQMAERAAVEDMEGLRYSEKVARLVWLRLAVSDRDIVRRGMALFSLPHLALEGSALVWGTADAIWTLLGDTSEDGNWYSKRAILAGVIASSVLYWLGDESAGEAGTRAFIDRRVADVMRLEKLKGQLRSSRAFSPLMRIQDDLMARFRRPASGPHPGFPGHIRGGRT